MIVTALKVEVAMVMIRTALKVEVAMVMVKKMLVRFNL